MIKLDKDTKRALPLLVLLLFVVGILPIGMILEPMVPKEIWLETAPVITFLLLPIAVFAVGTIYMEMLEMVSLGTSVIAMTISIVVMLSLLFLLPWSISIGMVPLNAITGLFPIVAPISLLVTLLLVGATGIGSAPGNGGTSKDTGQRESRETTRWFMSKEEKEAYYKGYSDYKKYLTDEPPDWKLIEYRALRFDDSEEAYKKGWKDRKEGEPPHAHF